MEDESIFEQYFSGKTFDEALKILQNLDEDNRFIFLPEGDKYLQKYADCPNLTLDNINLFYESAENRLAFLIRDKEVRSKIGNQFMGKDISAVLSSLGKKIQSKKADLIGPIENSLNYVWQNFTNQNDRVRISINPKNLPYMNIPYFLIVGLPKESLSMSWGNTEWDRMTFKKEKDLLENKMLKFGRKKIIPAKEGDFFIKRWYKDYEGVNELIGYLIKNDEIPLIKTLIYLPKIIDNELLEKEKLIDNILED